MKQKNYTKQILKSLNENNQVACEDCGATSKITHAIVDHQSNTMRFVCNDCFEKKYLNGLYPGKARKKPKTPRAPRPQKKGKHETYVKPVI